MRTILLAALVAVGLAACESTDGGTYDLSWSVVKTGQPSTCEAVGGQSVEFLATDADTGQGYADLFDCADYAGLTARLPLGYYSVRINLLDAADQVLAASQSFTPSPLLTDDLTVSVQEVVFAFP